MPRPPKATPKPAEYPLVTKGSKLAEQTRTKANLVTKAVREKHFKKAMAITTATSG